MMEKLGAPQTHLGLKNMIKEVDEDFDGRLSFREVPAHLWSKGPESPVGGALKGASHLQSPGARVKATCPPEC